MLDPPYALFRRPRLLNPLHALRLVNAHSQTNDQELARLADYAKGRKLALEIGTHMGVSAAIIAKALATGGKLFCVDPWDPVNGKENPCLSICKRELERQGVSSNVVLVHGMSYDVEQSLPATFDFIFVDGDHTYEGLRRDWEIVLRRLAPGGVVCLHDTSVPAAEPQRQFGSCDYFDQVISQAHDFEWRDRCYSMNILVRHCEVFDGGLSTATR
jgi:predicted O-methyltransferase YrrM